MGTKIQWGIRSLPRRAFFVGLAILVVVGTVAVAHAEWEIGVAANEGVSLMGGPIRYRLASANDTDGVDGTTGASVDAITSASRISHAGGINVQLNRGGSGQLVLGLEYVHYRFDLDYDISRVSMDVVGLRLLALARLALIQLRGTPFFSFGFGGYLEISIYDKAEIAGDQLDIELEPASFGMMVDFTLTPYRFSLRSRRGHLVPGAYFRAYRGLISQFRDERGSSAPLASFSAGLELTYVFPSSQGNGLAGR